MAIYFYRINDQATLAAKFAAHPELLMETRESYQTE